MAKESKRAGRSDEARLRRLETLIQILESSTLAELSYEDEDIAVTLRRAPAHRNGEIAVAYPNVSPPPPPPPLPPAAAPDSGRTTEPAPPPGNGAAAPAADPRNFVLKSPIVGTFYRSPSPEAPPFAEIGQRVKKGQPICIIEAMKLMNEIECEVDGTIAKILVENGVPVQYEEPLFEIEVR